MIDIPALKFILADGVQLFKLIGLVMIPSAAIGALILWRIAHRRTHGRG